MWRDSGALDLLQYSFLEDFTLWVLVGSVYFPPFFVFIFFFKGNSWFSKLISLEQAGINLAVNDGLFQMLFCMGQDRSSQ